MTARPVGDRYRRRLCEPSTCHYVDIARPRP